MKAIVLDRYGEADTLELRDVPVPTVGDDDVLVKVHAVSLNASDVEFMRGRPAYVRAWGLTKPRFAILGSDISGIVEAVGRNVTAFQPGDAVYGDVLGRFGGFAEYAAVPAERPIPKPAWLAHDVASTLPQAACIAYQALVDVQRIRPGRHVLVNGAGGGAGSFALQFCRDVGAEVTGVDHFDKQAFMHEQGATHALDYELFDYTRVGGPYDLVVDFVGTRSLRAHARAVKRKGAFVLVGGTLPVILETALLGPIVGRSLRKRIGVLMAEPNKYLDFISVFVGDGEITPAIGLKVPLGGVPEAMGLTAAGRIMGKVVVQVDETLAG